jgi:hypothetical protein
MGGVQASVALALLAAVYVMLIGAAKVVEQYALIKKKIARASAKSRLPGRAGAFAVPVTGPSHFGFASSPPVAVGTQLSQQQTTTLRAVLAQARREIAVWRSLASPASLCAGACALAVVALRTLQTGEGLAWLPAGGVAAVSLLQVRVIESNAVCTDHVFPMQDFAAFAVDAATRHAAALIGLGFVVLTIWRLQSTPAQTVTRPARRLA